MEKLIIAYYRVSTVKQKQSGLGLEAQQAAVQEYARYKGGKIIDAFQEVESGKRKDRPELLKALARARATGATLVIAKLDRLARNVHFISGLMESNVDFYACDLPDANRLTLHIMAAMAEHEAKIISERTKAALAAKRARGEQLGRTDEKWAEDRKKGSIAGAAKGGAAHAANAAKRRENCYGPFVDEIRALRASGLSYAKIAAWMNAKQFVQTTCKKSFQAMTVFNICKQYGILKTAPAIA